MPNTYLSNNTSIYSQSVFKYFYFCCYTSTRVWVLGVRDNATQRNTIQRCLLCVFVSHTKKFFSFCCYTSTRVWVLSVSDVAIHAQQLNEGKQ